MVITVKALQLNAKLQMSVSSLVCEWLLYCHLTSQKIFEELVFVT